MKEFTLDRIVIRKLKLDDKKQIFLIRSNKEISEHLDRPLQTKIEEAEEFIKMIIDGIENKEVYYWGIAEKETDNVIGTICLWNLNKTHTECDVGFELLPEYQKKGIMSTALKQILDFAFNEIGLKTVFGETTKTNFASINTMKKFGFTLDNTQSHKDEIMVLYSVTKEKFIS